MSEYQELDNQLSAVWKRLDKLMDIKPSSDKFYQEIHRLENILDMVRDKMQRLPLSSFDRNFEFKFAAALSNVKDLSVKAQKARNTSRTTLETIETVTSIINNILQILRGGI